MKNIFFQFYDEDVKDEKCIDWSIKLEGNNWLIEQLLKTQLELYLEKRFDFLDILNNALSGKVLFEEYSDFTLYVKITKEITTIEYELDYIHINTNPLNFQETTIKNLTDEEKICQINTQELKEIFIYCINELEKYKKEYAIKGIKLY
ncbi:hypothetical protein [[Clostridium] colinum]|uniref:hypothetical protein n=1 Tax=[Clostridium] colinum TaxID=36835 RepID=UPI002023C845|nr:hypothetical protein [[Clostridium] colinum]